MTEYSKDYHDYVFRNGKLVGEFEAMYQHSEGVPWHQDEQESWIDLRLTTQMLQDVGPFDEIHDLGCGLGYYLELAHRRMGSANARALGYDISATACAKARAIFPQFEFSVLDLTMAPETGSSAQRAGIRRLFIIRGTLWYVIPHLATVVDTLRSLMSGDDKLLVVQNFPPLNSTFVGKDVMPDHFALMRHFSRRFALVRHVWYEDTLKAANDNWFIGLFSLRDIK